MSGQTSGTKLISERQCLYAHKQNKQRGLNTCNRLQRCNQNAQTEVQEGHWSPIKIPSCHKILSSLGTALMHEGLSTIFQPQRQPEGSPCQKNTDTEQRECRGARGKTVIRGLAVLRDSQLSTARGKLQGAHGINIAGYRNTEEKTATKL